MARDLYISGESLVTVKGCVTSGIANLSQLCLTDSPITITFDNKYIDVNVDAWGDMPAEVQYKLGGVIITMRAVHFDPDILEACLAESQGGAVTAGQMTRAGTRLGGGVTRFQAGNHYIGLNITSPVASRPWRFLSCYLVGPPARWPIGTERSLVDLNWRCIPYTPDPWNNGLGAAGYFLWDRVADN